MTHLQRIASAFNQDWAEKKSGTIKRRRRIPYRPDHSTGVECSFRRGCKHTCYVTDAEGAKFKDITLIQRCACGARKVTRVSRTPVE